MAVLLSLLFSVFVAAVIALGFSAFSALKEKERIEQAKREERARGPRRQINTSKSLSLGLTSTPGPVVYRDNIPEAAFRFSSVSKPTPLHLSSSTVESPPQKVVQNQPRFSFNVEPQQNKQPQQRFTRQSNDFMLSQTVAREKPELFPQRPSTVSNSEPIRMDEDDDEREEAPLIRKKFTNTDSELAAPSSAGRKRRHQLDEAPISNDMAVHQRLHKIRKSVVGSSNPSTPTPRKQNQSKKSPKQTSTPQVVTTGTKRKQYAFPQDLDELTELDAVLHEEYQAEEMAEEDGWVTPASFRQKKRRRANDAGDAVVSTPNNTVSLETKRQIGKEDQVPSNSKPTPRISAVSTARGRIRLGSTPLKETQRLHMTKGPTPLFKKPLSEEAVKSIIAETESSTKESSSSNPTSAEGTPAGLRKVKFADESGGSLEAGPTPSGKSFSTEVPKFPGFGAAATESTKTDGKSAEALKATAASDLFATIGKPAESAKESTAGLFGNLTSPAKPAADSATNSLFSGLGTKPAEPSTTGSLLGGFGSSTAKESPKKDAPAIPPLPTFGSFSPASTDKTQEAPKPATSFSFGSLTAAPVTSTTTETTVEKPAIASSGGFSFGALGAATDKTTAAPGGFSFGGSETVKAATPLNLGSLTPANESAKTADKPAEAAGGFNFNAAPSTDKAASSGFSFGTKTDALTSNGDSSKSEPSGFSFGNLGASSAAPSLGASAAPPASANSAAAPGNGLFGATPAPPAEAAKPAVAGFRFGAAPTVNAPPAAASASTTPASTIPSFSFGATAPSSSTASTTIPSFSAGATANTSSTTGATGLPAPANSTSNAAFSFGSTPAAPTTTPSFGAAATPAVPSFGGQQTAATTPAPLFGSQPAPSNVPAFGAPAPTPAAAGGFGGFGAAAPSTATPFGSQTNSTGATTGFGSTAATSQPAANASFSFGGTAAPSTATPAFGATLGAATQGFGAQSTAPSAAGAAPTFSFGATTTPSTTSTTPAFGGFGQTPQTSTTPAFGQQPSAPATGGFGSAAPSASGFNFGSTAAAPTSTPAFGTQSSAPAFGQQASTPAFGQPPSTTPAFNFGATSTQAPPAFGQQPQQPQQSGGFGSTPAFGASAPSTSTTSFQFGAGGGSTAPPAFGQQQPAAASQPFVFGSGGGGGGAPSTSSSGFQFGAGGGATAGGGVGGGAAAHQNPLFAFGASGAAANGGGMFNMGSTVPQNKLERKLAQPKTRRPGARR
ncbi:hypothetical protein BDR26DRAFT_1009218 [Obelidium mucronatum]|nr:hypothetical protein BDR26DRAFT_1009218 [Obelidium mucronatum]